MLTGGAISEAQLLSQIGEWSNPSQLATALNKSLPGTDWVGGYFDNAADALAQAEQGPMAATLQAPQTPAHMVTIVPKEGATGLFTVSDTGIGATYTVNAAWIEQYVSGGVWKQ